MENICPYCGQKFADKYKLKRHINICSKNPNLPERYKRYLRNEMTVEERQKYLYEMVEITLNCQSCNKEYTIIITQKQYDINDYPHCCSSKCSHRRNLSENSKKKTSESLKEFHKDFPDFITDDFINATPHSYKIENGEKYLYIKGRRLKVYKCNKCGNEFTALHKRDTDSSEYCSKECAKECNYENANRKCSNKHKHKLCPICGEYDCDKDFCHNGKMLQKLRTLVKYFHFDEECIGTDRVFDEWERLKNELYDLYINQQLSTLELAKYYNYRCENMNNILKYFGIKRRSFSEAHVVAYQQNRVAVKFSSPLYKCGYHMTWEGKEVYLRSSYEFEYAEMLDNGHISYDVENIRLKYYDTQRCKERVAVPDFYIKNTNTIVEIKSEYTLDIQEMKDKIKVYKDNGYNFKLILEHKEVDIDDVQGSEKNIKYRKT